MKRYDEVDAVFSPGAGGIISSLSDMVSRSFTVVFADLVQLRWVRELVEPNVLDAKDVIRASNSHTVEKGANPDYPELGVETYGLGLVNYTYRGFEVIKHGGGIAGATFTGPTRPKSRDGHCPALER